MQSHVNFQTTLRSKHAVADVTAERLLACMNFHMRIQSTFDRKAFIAMIALIWPFTRMRANVSDEITRFAESFWTIFTFICIFSFLFLFYILLN
jgi:cation transport ATPase